MRLPLAYCVQSETEQSLWNNNNPDGADGDGHDCPLGQGNNEDWPGRVTVARVLFLLVISRRQRNKFTFCPLCRCYSCRVCPGSLSQLLLCVGGV